MRSWIFGLALGLAAASLLSGAETEPRYAPSVYINGVVNGASFTPAPDNFIVPTGIISIFGEDLALRTRQVSQEDLFQGRLPYSLGGVSVRIAGQLVPLYFVSPNQVNVQAPANLPRGETRLRINRESLVSNEVMVKVREVDPALFTVLGRQVDDGVGRCELCGLLDRWDLLAGVERGFDGDRGVFSRAGGCRG
jgi:hypothetical protein